MTLFFQIRKHRNNVIALVNPFIFPNICPPVDRRHCYSTFLNMLQFIYNALILINTQHIGNEGNKYSISSHLFSCDMNFAHDILESSLFCKFKKL